MFADIAVNVPRITSTFHYSIPDELRGRVAIGQLVTVPFGRQHVQGIVVAFVDQPEVESVKPVTSCVDPMPVLSPEQIALSRWLSEHCLAPLIDCLTLMLPPGLAKRTDTLYSLRDGAEAPLGARSAPVAQVRLVELLAKRGPLRGRQLARALPRMNWRAAAEALARQGVLDKQAVLDEPSVRPKHVSTVGLAVAPEVALAEGLGGRANSTRATRLKRALEVLAREGKPLEASWLYAESGASRSDVLRLADLGLVTLGSLETWRDPLAGAQFAADQPPELTSEQRSALAAIREGLDRPGDSDAPRATLLHGVTGSGKTEIYLRLLADCLARGRRGIVLVPEIALTPQTVRRFAARFPGRVAVIHSQLSDGERYDTWRRARQGLIDVVIGPRSALFAPLPSIGLIVVDEAHDDSYKQDPPVGPPYYHAREAAVEYAAQLGAACVLGTATPDVASYYRAERGEYRLLQLPRRILGHASAPASDSPAYAELPPVQVVDMRQELRSGNRSIFSRALRDALQAVLGRGEQAILFLNRRGQATYTFCRDCGYALHCSRCDMPLVVHAQSEQLVCHHCNTRRRHPERCPRCGSQRLRYFGAGTERVQAEVERNFPGTRSLRWDWDATRSKGAHQAILDGFASGQADVLVGTQMVAKGHDLPLVTLVGVVSADVGLELPDVRAAERSFQVLAQVAGRAGRGPRGGQVILQTFNPDHYVIQAAARHDYAAFYQRELAYRRELGYPPFASLVRLIYTSPYAERADRETATLAQRVRAGLPVERRDGAELIGPAPCYFGRVGGQHRWHLLLRGAQALDIVRGLMPLPDGWQVDVDPVSTL